MADSFCNSRYYYPRMRPTETLIFRQYDTREEALNRRTVFHTAAVFCIKKDGFSFKTMDLVFQTMDLVFQMMDIQGRPDITP